MRGVLNADLKSGFSIFTYTFGKWYRSLEIKNLSSQNDWLSWVLDENRKVLFWILIIYQILPKQTKMNYFRTKWKQR